VQLPLIKLFSSLNMKVWPKPIPSLLLGPN